MSHNDFHFKQFSITQRNTGMKVSVDAVLFGAWIPAGEYVRALDIGTGTGILTLMTAQRFPHTEIDTVEIDAGAYTDACHNIEKSPYAARIHPFCSDVRKMLDIGVETDDNKTNPFLSTYDLIICNPPFFNSSLVSKSLQRKTARHDDSLSPDQIFEIAEECLESHGKICVMYPTQRLNEIKAIAIQHGFYSEHITRIHKSEQTPPRICFIAFTRNAPKTNEDTLFMYDQHGKYTEDYKKLVRPFYLKIE